MTVKLLFSVALLLSVAIGALADSKKNPGNSKTPPGLAKKPGHMPPGQYKKICARCQLRRFDHIYRQLLKQCSTTALMTQRRRRWPPSKHTAKHSMGCGWLKMFKLEEHTNMEKYSMGKYGRLFGAALAYTTMVVAVPASAQDSDQEMAKELASPIAAIVNIPFQLNYDEDINPTDSGSQYRLNVQPVIPFALSNGAAIVTRTIIPLVYQDDVVPGLGAQSGLGDILFTAFYVPAPSASGLTWGVGPALLAPTSSDKYLGAQKWAAGAALVVVKQTGAWTVGGLANHLWDFAGSGTTDINNSLFQPFVAYNTPNLWTFSFQSETTYDWNEDEWAVPVNLAALKLVKFGKVPVNIGGGLGYWLKSSTNGPGGLRLRLQANVVLPKK